MSRDKSLAIYEEQNDPNQKWVWYIAVRIDTNPAYVSGVYGRDSELPLPSDDETILPKFEAKNIFAFRRGHVGELRAA